MKLATWNVNSIRARTDAVLGWIARNEPDVLCMQETKVVDDDFPTDELLRLGYVVAMAGQKTYNGVAIVSRLPMTDVVIGLHDEPDPVEQAPAPFADPADHLDVEQRMSRVWALVEELSPQQRAAVTLSCREGMATKDIAAVLSLSEATVRVHLHRALATLRRRIGDQA